MKNIYTADIIILFILLLWQVFSCLFQFASMKINMQNIRKKHAVKFYIIILYDYFIQMERRIFLSYNLSTSINKKVENYNTKDYTYIIFLSSISLGLISTRVDMFSRFIADICESDCRSCFISFYLFRTINIHVILIEVRIYF